MLHEVMNYIRYPSGGNAFIYFICRTFPATLSSHNDAFSPIMSIMQEFAEKPKTDAALNALKVDTTVLGKSGDHTLTKSTEFKSFTSQIEPYLLSN